MSKKMLINAGKFGETRVAVIQNGVLEELSMETSGLNQIKGNIYTATVDHVDRGLEAAFIDYGAARHGFIPLNEIPPKFFAPTGRSPSLGKPKPTLKKNTKLLVQVDRDPIRNKGASFTGYISLPGRYLVVMPYSSGGGISRKIVDPLERERLKNFMGEFNIPDNFGLIIRTAGLSVPLEELKKDYNDLMAKWNSILSAYNASIKPGLVSADSNLVIRSVRDYFSSDIEEVLVDNEEVYQSVLGFFRKSIPDSESILKRYQGEIPLFSKFGLDEQIEGIFSRVVPLPTGGSVVIDSTEALVAIDVNSGTGKGSSGQESLSFEINQAAAMEIARQLRLRDLGGLIVIDFIDMRNIKMRSQIKKIIQEEMKKDKARVEIGNISKFGLMELSRQRVKASPYLSNYTSCLVCDGKGMVQTLKFLSMNLLRKIAETASHASVGSGIKFFGGKEIIEFLINEKRAELQQIESDLNVFIHLFVDIELDPGKEKLLVTPSRGGEKEKTASREGTGVYRPTGKKEATPHKTFPMQSKRTMDTKEPTVEEMAGEPGLEVLEATSGASMGDIKPPQETQPEKMDSQIKKPSRFPRPKGPRRRFRRQNKVEKISAPEAKAQGNILDLAPLGAVTEAPVGEAKPQADTQLEKSDGQIKKPSRFPRPKGPRRRFHRQKKVEKVLAPESKAPENKPSDEGYSF